MAHHLTGSGLGTDDATLGALRRAGRSAAAREAIIEACLSIERHGSLQGAVRDEVTGPIVDALFEPGEVLTKSLLSGETFEFRYSSKIAREFVMSWPRTPDHVWEPQTTKTLVRLAARAKHALVGGAYFGDHAILMGRAMTAHGGVVHAFEPNVEQGSSLRRNVELNGLRNVRHQPFGLWDVDDARLRLDGADSHAHAVAAADADASSFPTVSIDGYVAREGLPGVDLVMLDIEGGELRALRGAQRELARDAASAPFVVFEIHRAYVDWTGGLHRTEIARWLIELGYHVFAIRDFNSNQDMAGRRIELVPADSAYLEGPPHGFNMLAVKDLARLEALGDHAICPNVSPKLLLHRDPALHHPLDGR